jgi:D-alanyl-D-alanine carboxypeptidase
LIAVQLPAVAVIGPTAEQLDEANERVDQLEDQATGARRDLDRVEDDLRTFDARLQAANEALAGADEQASAAALASASADAEAERTRRELDAASAALVANRQALADVVRDAYMHGGSSTSPLLAVLEQFSTATDPSGLSDVLHLLDTVVVERGAVVDDTRRLIRQTDQLTRAAADAAARQADEEATAQVALDRAAALHAETLALVAGAEDAAQQQRGLLEELDADRTAAERRVESLEDQARRAADAADAAVTIAALGSGLSRVGGITVATSLAPALEDLLESARADGYVLGGYGYRSPETTARMRRANGCPDVYNSPASSCRVPTARPGESMHEQGLAIDFNYQGRTICYPRSPSRCSGNGAFDWLRANAGRYGLHVLDTEAWHWSTNGQ